MEYVYEVNEMKMVRKLPSAEELQQEMPLTEKQRDKRSSVIKELQNILSGVSNRKIACIGPCSADNEKAVLEYMERLAAVRDKVDSQILIIPRVYTSKPRTNGVGYKGILHRPDSSMNEDDIYSGLKATRNLHRTIIQETEFFCADEMLYPEAFYYISDMLAYTAVGARSVENQQHRLVSSGLDMPVGMKNPTSGDIEIMLNAITAAQSSQCLLYHGWECSTNGNPYAHAILRGYLNSSGKDRSNYHYEMLCDVHDAYVKRNLKNVGVIIDCNHSNSRKHYDEQARIVSEVLCNCRLNRDINHFVKGFMIESYLVDGRQMIGEGIYGKSVTDPCLGWEKTEQLLYQIAEFLS